MIFGLVRLWLNDLLTQVPTGHNDLWTNENVTYNHLLTQLPTGHNDLWASVRMWKSITRRFLKETFLWLWNAPSLGTYMCFEFAIIWGFPTKINYVMTVIIHFLSPDHLPLLPPSITQSLWGLPRPVSPLPWWPWPWPGRKRSWPWLMSWEDSWATTWGEGVGTKAGKV